MENPGVFSYLMANPTPGIIFNLLWPSQSRASLARAPRGEILELSGIRRRKIPVQGGLE